MKPLTKAIGFGIFIFFGVSSTLPPAYDIWEFLGRISGAVIIAVIVYILMRWREKNKK